jgi:hypothetical protein
MTTTVSNCLHVVIGSGILGYALSSSNQEFSTAMGSAVHKGLFTKIDL